MVERVVEDERTPCLTLGMTLLVGRIEKLDGLRLARDIEGRELVPTNLEARRAAEKEKQEVEEALRREVDAHRKDAEAYRKEAVAGARREETEARLAAERRIAELEAKLRERG